jgi:hypothetical protein
VLNGLNCVVLLTKSTNPTVSSLATEVRLIPPRLLIGHSMSLTAWVGLGQVVELLGRDNPGVFAEVAKIRSSQE